MKTRKSATGNRARRAVRGSGERSKRGKQDSRRKSGPSLRTALLTDGRVIVIGLGGIGSIVCVYLTMFLASRGELPVRLVLVDGDHFEERNRERMDVPELGNKAVAWCRQLAAKFGRPGLAIRPVDAFVREENVAEIIKEKDLVLACLDNFASRKVLSERCQELRDVVLISGGNDGVEDGERGTYGNIQVFCRRGGVARNPSLAALHPEIQHPADEVPDLHCADLAATTAPQILFTNLAAASAMLNAFYRLLRDGVTEAMYDEVSFDIIEARAVPHWLKPQRRAQAASERALAEP